MLINPQYAIDQGWIKFPDWMSEEQRKKCVQPNAIDFTLDRLYVIDQSTPAFISEEPSEKVMRQIHDAPCPDGIWRLDHLGLYDGMSDFYVQVPTDVACDLIIRSTFNRVGVQLSNGMYDTGFEGNIGFTLFNRSGQMGTRPHTRIGQIMFFQSQSEGKYAGGYNTERGQHWLKGE